MGGAMSGMGGPSMGTTSSSSYQYSTLSNNNNNMTGQNYGTGGASHLLVSSTFPYALGQGLGASSGYMGGSTGYSSTGMGGVGGNYSLGAGLGSGLGSGLGMGSSGGLSLSHQYQQQPMLPSQGSLNSLGSEGLGLGRFGYGFTSGDYNNNNSGSNYSGSSYNNNNGGNNNSSSSGNNNPFVMRRSQAAMDVEIAGIVPSQLYFR